MPSKQALMSSHLSSGEILKWAKQAHDVCEKLVFVKQEADGSTTVRCCQEADHNDVFEGTGASKKEATADAISQRYPN